jgi:hypothetical protein
MAELVTLFWAHASHERGKLPLVNAAAAPSKRARVLSGSPWVAARMATRATRTSSKRRIGSFKHEHAARATRAERLDARRRYESPPFGPGMIGGDEIRGIESGAGSGSTSPKTSP